MKRHNPVVRPPPNTPSLPFSCLHSAILTSRGLLTKPMVDYISQGSLLPVMWESDRSDSKQKGMVNKRCLPLYMIAARVYPLVHAMWKWLDGLPS